MIFLKSPGEIEAMKEAGRISAKALRLAGAAICPGISTLELDEIAEEVIRQEGAIPAFKGYGGFPGTICASVNDQIVHGIPSKKAILKPGDIISIDTGAIFDGWVGDNAWTFPVGSISPRVKSLLEVTEKSLWAALEVARVGNHLGDIGYAVQTIAESSGLSVVREYGGHGIGRKLHEDPHVHNFGTKHSGLELREGMVLAIEPMLNLGTRKTRLMADGWLVCTRDKKPSAHFEKTVAITLDGPVILTEEAEFKQPR